MARLYKRLFMNQKESNGNGNTDTKNNYNSQVISTDISKNIKDLKNAMNNSIDIISKEIMLFGADMLAAVIFINNLVNEDTINEHIIKPITRVSNSAANFTKSSFDINTIIDSVITTGSIVVVQTFDDIVHGILTGDTFLCIQGMEKGLLINTSEFKGRTIGEPLLEPSVKGPQEAFVELLKDNLGLIRKRLRDPNLTFEVHIIGRRTKGNVVLAYMKGIVNEDIVKEVRKRIQKVDTDDNVGSAQVLHLLSDNPNSVFPLIQATERPDKTVASLLEGRVAIIVEGVPRLYLVPVTLPMLIQSIDDYYENWIVGSMIRLMRYIALFISAALPALYIAMTSFHPGLLPTILALSIAGSRTGVPFPSVIEAVLMVGTLELLQEAGIRLPRTVGQTVSIVGGLVIGQAAVQAGIISPIMVIVIAITAIASFAIPDYSLGLSTRFVRIPLMFLATTFGAYGIIMGILFILGYVCSLKSFGVRYLEPVTPYRIRDMKDTLIKAPQWTFGKRPEFLNPEDTQRQIIKEKGSGSNKRKS